MHPALVEPHDDPRLRIVICAPMPHLSLARQRVMLESTFTLVIDMIDATVGARRFHTWTSASLPTWLICRGDEIVEIAVGAFSDYELRRFVSDALTRFSSDPLLRARA